MHPAAASTLLLAVAYLGFISLGLPDTLFGVAWPSIRAEFHLPLRMAGTAFIAAGAAYALSAAMAGRILGKTGVGPLLYSSGAIVTLAVAGFALSPAWWLFVAFTFLHGLGSGAIDTGLNHYAARRFTARQMNWLHAAFGLGATLGPATMTATLVTGASWRAGYAVVSLVLLALTVLFFTTRRHWQSTADPSDTAPNPRLRETLALPAVRLNLALFFIYAGAESAVGQWTFTLLAESRGFSPAAAGSMVTAYWAALLIGRILSGVIVTRTGSPRLVRGGIFLAIVGASLAVPHAPAPVTTLGIILIGLAFAPIFPSLMTLTPDRVGSSHAANAIGLQVTAATLGISIIPALAGLAADSIGRESIPILWLALTLTLLLLTLPRRSGSNSNS